MLWLKLQDNVEVALLTKQWKSILPVKRSKQLRFEKRLPTRHGGSLDTKSASSEPLPAGPAGHVPPIAESRVQRPGRGVDSTGAQLLAMS